MTVEGEVFVAVDGLIPDARMFAARWMRGGYSGIDDPVYLRERALGEGMAAVVLAGVAAAHPRLVPDGVRRFAASLPSPRLSRALRKEVDAALPLVTRVWGPGHASTSDRRAMDGLAEKLFDAMFLARRARVRGARGCSAGGP